MTDRRMRVLVIEDSVALQERFKTDLLGTLELDNIELIQAHSIAEARAALRANDEFDVVALDGCVDSSTEADGAALIPEIRAVHPSPRPIIAISSMNDLRRIMVERGCTHECRKNSVPGMIVHILGLR